MEAASKGAEWTIVVYQSAANDLEEFASTNLNEMEAGLLTDRINVIVLFDGMKRGSSKLYRVVRDAAGLNRKVVSEVLDDGGAVIPKGGDVDSGDPATAKRLLAWAFKSYPAKRHGIVFWNHGSGLFEDAVGHQRKGNTQPMWAQPNHPQTPLSPPGGALAHPQTPSAFTTQGFGYSDKSGHNMKTSDVPGILQVGAQAAGKALEFVGFDACLMAHAEMTYQLRGLARNLIASEEVEPGTGWDYHAWLRRLSADPAGDGRAAGTYAVQAFKETFSPGGGHYGPPEDTDVTLSAVNYADFMSRVMPALNQFAGELVTALPVAKAAIKSARNATQQFDNKDCADLGSFAEEIAVANVPASLKASARQVREALRKAVVAHAEVGKNVQQATGQVVFFPKTKKAYRAEYDDSGRIAFAAEPWRNFVQAYVGLK